MGHFLISKISQILSDLPPLYFHLLHIINFYMLFFFPHFVLPCSQLALLDRFILDDGYLFPGEHQEQLLIVGSSLVIDPCHMPGQSCFFRSLVTPMMFFTSVRFRNISFIMHCWNKVLNIRSPIDTTSLPTSLRPQLSFTICFIYQNQQDCSLNKFAVFCYSMIYKLALFIRKLSCSPDLFSSLSFR